ncbi:MAG TPA: type II toxin-antitoxin system RelE/ParE family toxin [Rudaea sp.]|nr:type II toxin-antitoxin system RelE/ParE family toxin [Rudaea sp.]
MAALSYSERAILDLERLAEFAAQAGEDEARIIDLIANAIDVLLEHPHIGRNVDDYLSELVISHGRTGYVAMYRFDIDENVARILAIRHQREAGY